MATKTRTRPLSSSKSSVLTDTQRSTSSQRSTASQAKNLLNSGTLENIEIEYIKNLQTQVYFLELECNYLREQLDKHGLSSKFKTISKDKQPMHSIDEAKVKNLENTNHMLKEAQKNFENEKQSLFDEIALLKQENAELKERTDVLNSERNQTHVSLEIHHQELRKSKENFAHLDAQLDQARKDNTRLRSDVTELKLQLNKSEHVIKDLQRQVEETRNKKTSTTELRNTIAELNAKLAKEIETSKYFESDKQRLLKEVASYQQQLSEHKHEIQRLNNDLENSLKQNHTDLQLAKNNASILNSNVEQLELALDEQRLLNNKLQNQIDEYLSHEKVETQNTLAVKSRLRDMEDALEAANAKIHELTLQREDFLNKQRMADVEHGRLYHDNELLSLRILEYEKKLQEHHALLEETKRNRDSQFELFRSKADALQRELDETISSLKIQKGINKQQKVQNDSLILQDQSNQKLVASLKGRINDLELELHQSESKQSEILALRNELSSTSSQMNNKDDEIKQLRHEIDRLTIRLNEAERLKEIESVIKSQHWEEFGAIAENMKNLRRQFHSKTVSSAIGFDSLIKSRNSSQSDIEPQQQHELQHQQSANEIDYDEQFLRKQLSEPSAPESN